MNTSFSKITESLDLSINPVDITVEKSNDISESIKKENNLIKIPPKEEEAEKDYDYTRGNLYSLIEKGQEAINGIMELAQQSESPRAYEVAGQLIKNVGDVTDKLLDLQQKVKKLSDEGEKSPKNVTNNTMFVGSTADLQKILKQTLPEVRDSK